MVNISRSFPIFLVLALATAAASPARSQGDICPGSPVPPGGTACRFTLWSSEGCAIQLAPDGPDCRGLEKISSNFAALRDAAGFSGDQLKHLCGTIDWPETPLASYTAWNRCVNVNWAFLRKHGNDDDAIRFVLAHEISHGVQDRRGDMAWAAVVANDESPAGVSEFHRRRRILEAQADVVAIQLLERAGVRTDAAREGFEALNGCAGVSADEVDAGTATHPAARTRWLNMTAAASWIDKAARAEKLTARARRGLSEGTAADLSRIFDGKPGGSSEVDAVTGAPPAPLRAPLEPVFRRGDFSDQGGIRLKRAAVESFRPEPPSPWSGPVRKSVYLARVMIADALGQAVEWSRTSRPVSDLAVRACGRVMGESHSEAVSYGLYDAAVAATKKAVRLLLGPDEA